MLIDKTIYQNLFNLINTVLQRNRVVLIANGHSEKIKKFLNERYSIPIHESEQKSFLSILAMAINKSLPEKITNQINQM